MFTKLELYNSENFKTRYQLSAEYNMHLSFNPGAFGELLTCIVFNTEGTGVSTGWDTRSKLECKTGTRIPPELNPTEINRGSIRWGISPKTHNKWCAEQSDYVLTFMDFYPDYIHTTMGTLNPLDPTLAELIETAKETLNLPVWGESVNTLPIRIVDDHIYDIHNKTLEQIYDNIGSTTYFGRPTGRKLKDSVGKARGNVKR